MGTIYEADCVGNLQIKKNLREEDGKGIVYIIKEHLTRGSICGSKYSVACMNEAGDIFSSKFEDIYKADRAILYISCVDYQDERPYIEFYRGLSLYVESAVFNWHSWENGGSDWEHRYINCQWKENKHGFLNWDNEWRPLSLEEWERAECQTWGVYPLRYGKDPRLDSLCVADFSEQTNYQTIAGRL